MLHQDYTAKDLPLATLDNGKNKIDLIDFSSPRDNRVKRKVQASVVYFGGNMHTERSMLSNRSMIPQTVTQFPQSIGKSNSL